MLKLNSAGAENRSKSEKITIVSGLPRSGTTMMMRMLEAGGLEVMADGIRKADEDNPKGYYEVERVKELEKDSSWLAEASGKAIKIISALLKHLPSDLQYRIVFMRRNMAEILASQSKMLKGRLAKSDTVSDEILAKKFEAHLAKMELWLKNRDNIDTLFVNYNDVINSPSEEIGRISAFFNDTLDREKMIGIIDHSLYRQRK